MTTSNPLAPEAHNDEQDDEQSQAHQIALQAKQHKADAEASTESVKSANKSGLMGDSTQDVIDHMRDMEQSGRIDMDAFRGEPNMDDNAGKYGAGHDAEFEGDDS
ncbi:MAG: hypothetical protein R3E14_08390 [Erythrobacter sp.]